MTCSKIGGDKGKSENKVRNLTIGKMMDNFNVYMNSEKGIDKQQLLQAVTEILRTAAVDFASSNDWRIWYTLTFNPNPKQLLKR